MELQTPVKVLVSLLFLVVSGLACAASAELSETAEIQFLSGDGLVIAEKAAELATPVRMYEFVRNEFDVALYQGSRSGSINSFLGKRGNDVDTASVLISLLRSQGYPARYVVGTVREEATSVASWLRVADVDLAYAVLRDQGIQNVALAPDKSYMEFEHVWVEVLSRLEDYRGTGADTSAPCTMEEAGCHWVPLAPAFKQHAPGGGIDVYGQVTFDYDGYYRAIADNNPAYKDKSPLEIYEEQVLQYLVANHPGKTLEDATAFGGIEREELRLLPLSLPFEVVSPVRRYTSVDDHDAEVAQGAESKRWAKYLDMKLNLNGFVLNYPNLRLSDLTTKRLTVSWYAGETSDVLAARLDGEQFGSYISGNTTINGVEVVPGVPFTIELTMDGAPAADSSVTDTEIQVTYQAVVGGYYLIGTGGDVSNWSQVHRAAGQLLEANDTYRIVNDSNGVPFVDLAKDGTIDSGDPRLLDHLEAMDALTGGLLYTAMNLYYARFHDGIRRLDSLNHAISPIEGFVGVVSSVYDVEYIDGTAFSIMPGGLLIDMKGQRFSGAWRGDQPEQFADAHFELVGHVMSSYEHEIWQELTGYDAVSTVRGIQMALGNGAQLLDLKKTATEDTFPASYPALGFSGAAPAPFQINARTIFNDKPRSWSLSPDDGQSHVFETFKESLNGAESDLHLGRATYFSTNGIDGFLGCVDNLEDDINDIIAQHGNVSINATFCDGSAHSGPAQTVLGELESYYYGVTDSAGNEDFFDYFDYNQGFRGAQWVYRDPLIDIADHETTFIQQLRNNVYLSEDVRQEYRLPSKLTVGSTYRFSVYLHKQFDPITDQLVGQSYQIANKAFSAGGGWVDGSEFKEETSDTTGEEFNNELFNSHTMNSFVNNDLVRTPSTVDPVSTVTGNMYHDETDVVIKGRGLNIVFTRTYNSNVPDKSADGKPLSLGWTHSYNMRLHSNDFGQFPNYPSSLAPENDNGTSSSVTYVDERGGESNYLLDDTDGTYAVTPPKASYDTLELDTPAAGFHTVTFRNGVKYVFEGGDLKVPDTTARLARIEDPYGNQLLFGYTNGLLTSITDNLGLAGRNGLTLTYTADDRLERIADWTGREWVYTYDAHDRLSGVIDPQNLSGNTYTYHRESHLLQDIAKPEDRNGTPWVTTFNYYRNDKAFNYINSLGEVETLDYDLYRKRTRITGPRGYVTEHHYDENGALVRLRQKDGGLLFFENNDDGLRYSKTDALGNRTRYSYRSDRAISTGGSDTGGQVTLEQDPLGNTIEYDYGIHDQPTRIKDKNGNERINTYYTATDPLTGAFEGKLAKVEVTLDGGLVTLQEIEYTSFGRVKRRIEYVDPNDPARRRITEHTYDASGLNIIETLVSGATSGGQTRKTFVHDDLGRKLSETVYRRTSATDSTELALTTTWEYDDLSRPVRITDPLGNITETIYDANGKEVEKRRHFLQPDGTFVVRTLAVHAYDAFDRRISTTDTLGNTVQFDYDAAGNLIRRTDPNGNVTRYDYDGMDRRTAVIDANSHRTETEYDLGGRVVAIKDANGNVTRFEYDALGRQTRIVSPLGFETLRQYDPNGNVTHETDANVAAGLSPANQHGVSVYTEYDELNRAIRTVNAENGETVTAYDLLGNVTAITDAEGRATEMVYDDLGRLVEVIDPVIETPADRTVTYTHDEAGNVLTRTDRNGETIRHTYDNANRLVLTEFLADGTTETRSHDVFGNLESIGNADVTYTFAYDALNRLTAKTDSRNSKSMTWEYDAAGNVIRKTDFQGDVTEYQYDSTNRLVAMANTAYLQASYQYDGAGRLLTRILSNGARTEYAYDADNRLVMLANFGGDGNLVETINYQYDRVGNITQTTTDRYEGSETVAYDYDALYRLTAADYPGTELDLGWTYDKVGNRKTQSRQSGDLFYLYDDGNRLLEIHQGSETGAVLYSYTYDDNGSRIEKRDGENNLIQGYAWDQKRRIESVQQGSGAVDMVYDTSDYRVGKQSGTAPEDASVFYREAEHLEAVYDGNDTLKEKYLRGTVVDELINGYSYDENGQGTSATYHHDHLRSVVAETGHDGAVLSTIQYDPFGNVLNETGIPQSDLRYTGRMYDPETGLYYYRARYYDAEVGRFISEDPLGFEAGVNFYAYVLNNPIRFADPNGLDLEVRGHPAGEYNRDISFPGGSSFNISGSMGAMLPGPTAYHLSIVYTPNSQAAPSSIGAQPGGSTSWSNPWPGNLQYVPNFEGDLAADQPLVVSVPVPVPYSEEGFAQVLFDSAGSYQNSANYDFPPLGENTYNSNSFISGVFFNAGFDPPAMPQVDNNGNEFSVPGYESPVPSEFFQGNASGGFVIYPSRVNLNSSRAYGK